MDTVITWYLNEIKISNSIPTASPSLHQHKQCSVSSKCQDNMSERSLQLVGYRFSQKTLEFQRGGLWTGLAQILLSVDMQFFFWQYIYIPALHKKQWHDSCSIVYWNQFGYLWQCVLIKQDVPIFYINLHIEFYFLFCLNYLLLQQNSIFNGLMFNLSKLQLYRVSEALSYIWLYNGYRVPD